MSKRRFTREFKLTAVRRMQVGEPVARLARELGAGAFMGSGHKQAEADRVAELERKIGQQALEIDFLKRALQRVEEQRQLRALAGGARSTNKSNGKSPRDEV